MRPIASAAHHWTSIGSFDVASAKPRDVLGSNDASLTSASEMVRRWDIAFVSAALVLAVVALLLIGLLWAIGQPVLPRGSSIRVAAHALTELASWGKQGWKAWAWLCSHPTIGLRLAVLLLASSTSSAWVFWQSAKPTSRVRHIEGDRLLEGREAARAARVGSDPKPWAYLHPVLGLAKERYTRHGLISGGVGRGKTQILWPLIEQIAIKMSRKAVIYDVKGDYTAAMPDALLIAPSDARSAYWDISADIRTPEAAETLAQSLIPSKDGEFWGPASRAIVVGVLISLIYERQHEGKQWGWRSLADRLMASDPYELHDLMATYYPPGLRLLADPSSTTALNVLQTIAAHTRVIEQLAVAWGNGEDRKSFSFRRWATDGYKGPRQIILQAGRDRELTSKSIAAMFNTLIPYVINPSLKDAEHSRTLAFFIDEFTSLGRIDDIASLIDKGRSKGCVVWLGFQSIEQVKERYSQNFASALMSMVGTHVVCGISMGETQAFIANLFGKRRVAITSFSQSPGSTAPSIAQHEETRPVVLPSQLGALGVVKRARGYIVQAIVKTSGISDPLLLEFPVKSLPKFRPEFVPAEWTKGVPKHTKRRVAPADNSSGGLKRPTPEPEQSRSEGRDQDGEGNSIDPLDRVLRRKTEQGREH